MRAMTAKAARNRRSKTSVSLTLAAVATHATGTPSPSTATLYFVPRLARSVGLGPVRSPPRLARTEQLSRIRSGWPRSMPTGSVRARASKYRLCFRTGDDVRSCGFQHAQHRHSAAEELEAAPIGGNRLVMAGAEAEKVAEFVV